MSDSSQNKNIPLVVDLDGTLVRTDTLWESFFAAWAANVWLPITTFFLLFRGRAALKRELSARAFDSRLTIETLPINEAVLARVRDARAQGRMTVLATAADERIANAVAARLNVFDRVYASDGASNLKGATKTEKLIAEFGAKGFDYIGDSRADAPVWRAAREAFTVSSIQPNGVVKLEGESESKSAFASWTKLLRVRHWIKNILVFVALFAAHRFTESAAWQHVLLTFVAFCAVCSGIYVFNDLFDLSADRTHPSKRFRPLAAGQIALPAALLVAIASLAGGLALAFFVGHWVGATILVYCIINGIYTLYAKRIAVLDVSILAALYTLRIVAGAVAIAAPLSPWLFAFSVFAFLSLALLKRAIDINRLAPDETLSGRGYTGRDAMFVNVFGSGAAIAAVLVLALYIAAPQATPLYRQPAWLWCAVAVVLFWLMRMWRLAMRGASDDDPVLFATRDATSWVCVALIAACFVAAT
jgi:4-hydroxybenzoate polyprenyltransferase/phosphoserine phosphatase